MLVIANGPLAQEADLAAPLSGRCPVILKTDMTHLANQGEPRERILAGLFDAIAESAEALVKPRRSPPRVVLVGGVARARRVREHFRTFLEARGMTLEEVEPAHALLLEAAGCAHAARGEPADVLVVNTCTVTRRADQEARQLIRRLASERPDAAIVVAGCYAQRAPEELRGLPGVRAVLGTTEREEVAPVVLSLAGAARGRTPGSCAIASRDCCRPA